MSRILIAEDEPRVTAFLEKGLRAGGFTTTAVADGASAVALARDENFDLLILDLGLPGLDGTEVLRTLRAQGQRLPILILTARDDVRDKVAGLDLGADDYVTKPFEFDELIARVKARLRPTGADAEVVLVAGGVELDLRTRRARVAGKTIELSAREFALLELFMRHPDQVLRREQLLSGVWGYDFDPASNVVEVYVGYLRRKLGPDHIDTARGMGYRLVATPPASDAWIFRIRRGGATYGRLALRPSPRRRGRGTADRPARRCLFATRGPARGRPGRLRSRARARARGTPRARAGRRRAARRRLPGTAGWCGAGAGPSGRRRRRGAARPRAGAWGSRPRRAP